MNLKRTLLAAMCAVSILLPGCSQTTPAAQTSASQVDTHEAFISYTTDLLNDILAPDTLSLNSMIKNPESYQISKEPAGWCDVLITDEDWDANKKDIQDSLNTLEQFSDLTGQDARDYEVLKYFLNAILENCDFKYFNNNFHPLIGLQTYLPLSLSEYRFDTLEDIDDYLTLLETFDDYVDQCLSFEKLRSEHGYSMCKASLEQLISDCGSFIADPESNMLIITFEKKLNDFPDLTDTKRDDFIERNHQAVQNSVIPAYRQMIQTFTELLPNAPEAGNLSSYENGKAYYDYMLKYSVGTDKSAEELIKLTEYNMNDAMSAMHMILNSDSTVLDQASNAMLSPTDPQEILEHLKSTLVKEQFPAGPDLTYTIKEVDSSLAEQSSPAMYLQPRLDDYTTNLIYTNLSTYASVGLLPTLAHEGYPGHMYQFTYYYATHPNPIRRLCTCLGYVEGWACYAQKLSYNYCGLPENVASFLSIYEIDFMLNLYCRADLGIHYEGWTLDEFRDFYSQYLSTNEESIQYFYNTIINTPTNYLIYGIGFEELLELLDDVKDRDGDDFDIVAFHKEFLDCGPAPFPLIRQFMLGE